MVTTFSKRARTRSILVLFALIIGLLFSFWFLFARTRPLIVLSINAPSTEMFCFTPDSQAVVIANKNNLNIWNIDTNKLEAVLGGHDQAIKSIIASSTGELLVSVDEAGVFCFWDVSVRRRHVPARSNECLGEMGSGFRVSPKQGGHDILACLSPHGKWLAVKTLKEIVICDIQSGDKVASVRSDDFKTIESIVFSPNGDVLASTDGRGNTSIWELPTGQLSSAYKGLGEYHNILTFTPDGRCLVQGGGWGGGGENICFRDLATGQESKPLRGLYPVAYLNCLAFSPDGKMLAAGVFLKDRRFWGSQFQVRMWNWPSLESIGIIECENSPDKIVISPDGKFLAELESGALKSYNSQLKIWDISKVHK